MKTEIFRFSVILTLLLSVSVSQIWGPLHKPTNKIARSLKDIEQQKKSETEISNDQLKTNAFETFKSHGVRDFKTV